MAEIREGRRIGREGVKTTQQVVVGIGRGGGGGGGE